MRSIQNSTQTTEKMPRHISMPAETSKLVPDLPGRDAKTWCIGEWGALWQCRSYAQVTEWLDSNAGWTRMTVTISAPFSRWSANPGPSDYSVPNFYHRSLVSILHKRVLDPNDHHLFHYEPYELRWRRPRNNCNITVHGELFTSKSFLDAHRELLESLPVPECTLPCRIVAFMFWSDATQLTSFGDAKLWPLYVFFGNQTKYRRGQPSTKLCSHVAYFQMVSMISQFLGYLSVLIPLAT